MKYLLLLFLLIVIFWVSKGPAIFRWFSTRQERALTIRMGLFMTVLAVLVLVAAFYLPGEVRALVLVPLCLGGMGMVKVWRNAHLRARQQAEDRVDFDRMKRVNKV